MDRTLVKTLSIIAACVIQFAYTADAQAQIPWTNDIGAASRAALSRDGIVMLHFYSDNCVPCKMLDSRAYQDPGLINKIKMTVIPVKIHVDSTPQVAQKYHVTRWPTDVYLAADGTELVRTVSPQKTADYLKLLERVEIRNRDYVLTTRSQQMAMSSSTNDRHPPSFASANTTTPSTLQVTYNASPEASSSTGAPPQGANNGFTATGNSREVENSFCVAPPTHPALQNAQPGQQTPQNTVAQAQSAPSGSSIPPAITPPQPQFNAQAAIAPSPNNRFLAPAQAASFSPQMSPTQAAQPTNAPGSPNASRPTQPSFGQPVRAQLVSNKNSNVSGLTDDAIAQQIELAKTRISGPAMNGYCPVALDERSEWVEGSESFSVRHRGRIYLLSSAQAQTKFLESPDRFAPMLSGFDLVHFLRTGDFADGLREYGCWYRGRVYLFATAENREYFDQNVMQVAATAEAIQPANPLKPAESDESSGRIANAPQWTSAR